MGASRLLSPEEMESLLAPPAGAAPRPDGRPVPFDVDRPPRLSRAEREKLARTQGGLARALSEVLERHLGPPFQVGLTHLGEASLRALANTWGAGCLVLRGRPRGGKGEVFASLSCTLELASVERLLGGAPAGDGTAARSLTDAEKALLAPLHADILAAAGRAWGDSLQGGLEALPPQAGWEEFLAGKAVECCLSVHFGAAAPGFAGEVRVAVPMEWALRSVRREGAGPAPRGALTQPLARVPLDLTVRLGSVRLTLGEVRRLRPSDLIALDQGPGERVEVLVEGSRKWWARVGQARGKLAVRLLEAAAQPSDPGGSGERRPRP